MACVCLACAGAAQAALPLARLHDGLDGATCAHFNAGARLAWRERGGDWRDARDALHGDAAFAGSTPLADDGGARLAWDVTRLVRDAQRRGDAQAGILLRRAPGASGGVALRAREARDPATHPLLRVAFDGDDARVVLGAAADATLDCSTARALGRLPLLRVHGRASAALAFDLAPLAGRVVREAALVVAADGALVAPPLVEAFALAPPLDDADAAEEPTLVEVAGDDGDLGGRAGVLLVAGFESADWLRPWRGRAPFGRAARVAPGDDAERGFVPLAGHALRVRIPPDANTGLDLSYRFRDHEGGEPEEIHFRYYLRLAADWLADVDGGKLPGLAGTYGRAGWGGRRSDGRNGWSLRGHFNRAPFPDNPLHGSVTVATYAYHADMAGEFGDEWPWTIAGRGVVERNRWYCIEQHVKLNAPGASDGVVRAWVDGGLALERRDVRLRDDPALRIERVWLNVYHGGTATPARELVLYIDEVVVARSRIGCRG